MSNSLHSILDQAIWNGEEIRAFLQRDSSSINHRNQNHETPMIRVLKNENCSAELVGVLLEYGAEVNGRNGDGKTPLMAALEQNRSYAIIATLLEKGADVSLFDDSRFIIIRGRTAFCYALRCEASKDVFELLLEAGCDPNACEQHASALECVSDYPKGPLGEGILEMLISAGANLLRLGRYGRSPVCLAFEAGAEVKDIKRLLRLGASLNACEIHNYSVWECYTDCNSYYERLHRQGIGYVKVLRSDMIELIVKEGARYEDAIRRDGDYSPFQVALRWRKYEPQAIKMLLDFASVDVNVRDSWEDNLLHLAVHNDHCELRVIELLIERGTKVDEINYKNRTPLHTSIYFGSEFWKLNVQQSVISTLLKNNSHINAVDKKGNTPLRAAVNVECHSDVIHLLLSSGARIGVPNCGFSLLRLALDQYLQKKCQFILDSLKSLIKFYILENPDFEIERLTRGITTDNLATELKYLADECAREVRIMDSNTGENQTLLKLIRERSLPKIVAADQTPAVSSDSLDNILRIMSNHTISHFLADIAAMVGKSAMDKKLQELQVYRIEKRPVPPHMEEKVILIYDCVRKVTSFLTLEDTMRLILAYYIPTNQTNSKDSVTKSMKRKSEEPDNCDEY